MSEDDPGPRFEAYLQTHLPTGGVVQEAMAYALGGGGKRLRPRLLLMAVAAVGGTPEDALPAALAVEAIHTYSLVHDDLPEMDNDDFRRGRPSCHRVFGAAVAILAGDGLLTWGLGLLANQELRKAYGEKACLDSLAVLAEAIGHAGMVGGQALDLGFGEAGREEINQLKTAALFGAAAEMGAILVGHEHLRSPLRGFGQALGRAFQAVDDRLDLKAPDQAAVRLLEEASQRHTEEALGHLEPLGSRGQPLVGLVERLNQRQA